MTNPEVKIRLSLDGAQQVQAGTQAAADGMERLGGSLADISNASQASAAALQRIETLLGGLQAKASSVGAAMQTVADANVKIDSSAKLAATSIDKMTASTQALAASAPATQAIGANLANAAKAAEAAGQTVNGAGKKIGEGLQQVGDQSAKAGQKMQLNGYQAAQLSAQLQDLFVQIQAGGAPLTAFIQQGSQLSAVFGGFGNALNAVKSLFNPTRIAIGLIGGAITAVSIAAYQGDQEMQNLRRTVILTGGVAGVTANQISDMAANIRNLGGGTQGRASEVLNQLAQSSAVGAANMQRFTDAALRLERVSGPAAEETAKAFQSLAKSPLEASLKLNESTNFLTRSVYEQIRALEQQGRTFEAVKVAQEAYASTLEQRIPQLAANLGVLEKAWRAVAEGGKQAWDSMLNVGRDSTLSDQIGTMEKEARRLRAAANNQGIARPQELFTALTGGPSLDEQAKAAERLVEHLRNGAREQARLAQATADGAKGVKALADYQKESDRYLSNAVLMQRALNAAVTEGVAAGASLAEIVARVNAIRQQYDPGVGLELVKQAEQARLEIVKRGVLEINALRAAGVINEYEQIDRLAKADVAALEIKKQAVQQELALAKQRINSEREVAALQGQAAALNDQIKTRELQQQKDIEAAQQKRKVAAEQANEAQREETRAAVSAFEAQEKLNVARAQMDLNKQAVALQEEAQLLQQEAKFIGASTEARQLAVAALRVELDLKRKLKEIDETNKGAGEAERNKLRDTARANAAQQLLNDQRKAQLSEWQNFFDDINRGLTDSLYRAFESGKGFFKSLWDGIRNTFKTSVMKLAVQAVMSPVNQLLSSAVGGAGGLGQILGIAGAAGSAGGLSGGLAGALGLTGLSFTSLGSALGAGFMSTLAGGTIGGGGAAGLLAGGAATGTGAAGMLGAALPWVGAAALVGNALGLFRTTKTVGGGITGTLGQGDISNFEVKRKSGTLFSGPDYSTPLTGVATQSTALQDAYKGLRESAVKMAEALGVSAAGVKNFVIALGSEKLSDDTGGIGIRTEGLTAEQVAEKVKTALVTANDALAREVLGTYADAFKKEGESASQTLERLAGSLTGVNEILASLGQSAMQATVQGADAASKLVDLFGGLSNYQGLSAQYFEAYYSEAERTALVTAGITKTLGGLNLALPATREAYKALVESQDRNTDAGRKAYATLLQLAPAFAEITAATADLSGAATDSAQALAEAAKQIAEAGRRALADLATERGNLDVDLLRAKGNSAGADALAQQQALAKITAGLSADDITAATAAFQYNQALRDQATTLRAAAQAQADETARQAAVADQRAGLESRLLEMQGNTTALRERELAALDAANRDLLRNIFAEQDAQAIASERAGIETQLQELQGDTAALRARELEALDPLNRALKLQYYALQDQQAVAQTAAQALQNFNDVLASLGSTRFDLESQVLTLQGNDAEVKRRARERFLAEQTKGMTADEAARVAAAYDLNVALQVQIKAMEDARTAAEEQARAQQQAAEQATRAAEQAREAWQRTADTIFAEAARLRGLTTTQTPAGLVAAQANFAIATAQARAGDQDAAGRLPELARALVEIGETQASSLLELQRLRAATAASLEATGGRLAGTYGLTIPKLATGTNYVPRDMLAFLHEGEAVQPRAYNPQATGAGGEDLAQEVRALRQEVAALLEAASRTAKATEGTRDMINTATEGGRAMQTEAYQ